MNKGYNKFKPTPDNHDFMTPEHISVFLRNHRTGVDNNGRQALARIIEKYDNPKVLDLACGTCVNWEMFRGLGVKCDYHGMDRTHGMLEEANRRYGEQITLHHGYVQETNLPDGFADVVIMRHILEHLTEGYELAVSEGLRVAKKELIVVFFLDPSYEPEDKIEESTPDENGCTYWWNVYSFPKFTNFILSLGYSIQIDKVVTFGAAHADTIVRIIK